MLLGIRAVLLIFQGLESFKGYLEFLFVDEGHSP